MREILFRGKRLNDEENEWAYGSYVKQYECDMIYFPTAESDGFDYAHIIPETVGQYTGLTDKNGKKIFEGDIINCYSPFGINDFRNCIVAWSELFLGWRAGTSSLYGGGQQVYEIIGNIHDNPELLKGGVEE